MNSDSRISNRITDIVWRVPRFVFFFYWHFHKSRWKDSLIRFRSSSVSFLSFLLMLISTHWDEVWKMVLLSFDSLEKQSNVKRGRSPYCKHTTIYICACLCTLSICSMFKRKSQNVCRHQPLENDEETKKK